MGLLSDQLLKAGLVTEEQVKKAEEKPKKQKRHVPSRNKKHTPKKQNKLNKPKETDLAQFYKQRASLEKNEKKEAEKKKQEAARIKKETNGKINKLISDNLLNVENAEIRFNFIVGTTIKYLFVTEEQQKQLAEGQLAITFLGGKRAIIPAKTAEEIKALNPNKIVILSDTSNEDDSAEGIIDTPE